MWKRTVVSFLSQLEEAHGAEMSWSRRAVQAAASVGEVTPLLKRALGEGLSERLTQLLFLQMVFSDNRRGFPWDAHTHTRSTYYHYGAMAREK